MMIGEYLNKEKGQLMILFALTLPILLGMVGISVDIGNLYYQKAHLQTMVDAAALAGVKDIASATNHINANIEAQKYVDFNSNKNENITVDYPSELKNSTIIYDPSKMLIVKANKEVKTYFIGMIPGIKSTVSVSAVGVAELKNTVSGNAFAYSIFSGSINKSLTISGNTKVTGNAHTNQNLILSGNPSILGNAEALGNITLSGTPSVTSINAFGTIYGSGSLDIGSEKSDDTSVTNISMPDFSTSIKNDAKSEGQSYTEDPKWKNDTLSESIYVNDDVSVSGKNTIDSSSQLLATGTIKISGTITAVDNNTQQQLLIYSIADQDAIIVSGNTTIDGIIYAPNGTVKITGNVIVNGAIVANNIDILGNLEVNGITPVSIPSSGETKAALIQ